MKLGIKPIVRQIVRQIGSDLLAVNCLGNIVEYQTHMDGVDMVDQHRVMYASFTNVTYFKKWHKKVFTRTMDFSFMQACSTCILSADEFNTSSRK